MWQKSVSLYFFLSNLMTDVFVVYFYEPIQTKLEMRSASSILINDFHSLQGT